MAILNMTPEIQAECDWAFRLMLQKGDALDSALKFQRALAHRSPVLGQRLQWAFADAFGSPATRDALTDEDRRRVGELIRTLGERREGAGPGRPVDEGGPRNGHNITIIDRAWEHAQRQGNASRYIEHLILADMAAQGGGDNIPARRV